MEFYPIYIGGEFRRTDRTHRIINPYDHTVVAETCLAGDEELDEAIEKALAVRNELRDMPSYRKYEILMQIMQEITDRKQWFTRLMCSESAKPWKYAAAEVERAIQCFRLAAEECKRLPMEYMTMDWTPAGEGKEGLVRYFPVGVVAGITPFNFPLNLVVHKIAPAIAAGCPILLKPSPVTPLSALALAQIIDLTTLPKGAVTVIAADNTIAGHLATDPRISMLSFTGSPAVGWQLKQVAGKKKVVLELGGNAGTIITDNGNINNAAGKCVTGGFAYSGQVCIHTQRIFVQKKIFDNFIRIFIQEVKKLKYGDPCDPATDISVMIDEKNAVRVEEWVNEAVVAGAKIHTGGKRNGSYYEPTVLSETDNTMKVCSLEVFGPVVTLEPYDTFSEAIDQVNDSEFGLQAGVFTNNLAEMNEAFRNLDVGGVIINDTPTFRVDHVPYGGIKNSGLGREGIKYAIREMTVPRILVKNF
jgi:acyl-CoA reductase-like NAD-dependent aldehyde dehydrogenase